MLFAFMTGLSATPEGWGLGVWHGVVYCALHASLAVAGQQWLFVVNPELWRLPGPTMQCAAAAVPGWHHASLRELDLHAAAEACQAH